MLKTILRISFTVSIALVASIAGAQQAPPSVSVPVVTFVVDSAGGLRPLIGIARSASVGTPLDLGFGIAQAAVPGGHDYVLGITDQTNWPVFLQVSADAATARPLDSMVSRQDTASTECPDETDRPWGQPPTRCTPEPAPVEPLARIDSIALSPTGSAAALMSNSAQRIYAVSNMPGSPTLIGHVETGLIGSVSAFAISDDGRTLAVGVSDGARGGLYLIRVNQPPHLIAAMAHPSAITFLRNSESVIIADDVENKIYKFYSGQMFAIAAEAQGIAGPIAVAVSNNNQKVFVANSVSGSVTTIPSQGLVPESLSCNCKLTGLHPTNTDSVFRLTDFAGGPVLLFDESSAPPRLTFVRVASGN